MRTTWSWFRHVFGRSKVTSMHAACQSMTGDWHSTLISIALAVNVVTIRILLNNQLVLCRPIPRTQLDTTQSLLSNSMSNHGTQRHPMCINRIWSIALGCTVRLGHTHSDIPHLYNMACQQWSHAVRDFDRHSPEWCHSNVTSWEEGILIGGRLRTVCVTVGVGCVSDVHLCLLAFLLAQNKLDLDPWIWVYAAKQTF